MIIMVLSIKLPIITLQFLQIQLILHPQHLLILKQHTILITHSDYIINNIIFLLQNLQLVPLIIQEDGLKYQEPHQYLPYLVYLLMDQKPQLEIGIIHKALVDKILMLDYLS